MNRLIAHGQRRATSLRCTSGLPEVRGDRPRELMPPPAPQNTFGHLLPDRRIPPRVRLHRARRTGWGFRATLARTRGAPRERDSILEACPPTFRVRAWRWTPLSRRLRYRPWRGVFAPRRRLCPGRTRSTPALPGRGYRRRCSMALSFWSSCPARQPLLRASPDPFALLRRRRCAPLRSRVRSRWFPAHEALRRGQSTIPRPSTDAAPVRPALGSRLDSWRSAGHSVPRRSSDLRSPDARPLHHRLADRSSRESPSRGPDSACLHGRFWWPPPLLSPTRGSIRSTPATIPAVRICAPACAARGRNRERCSRTVARHREPGERVQEYPPRESGSAPGPDRPEPRGKADRAQRWLASDWRFRPRLLPPAPPAKSHRKLPLPWRRGIGGTLFPQRRKKPSFECLDAIRAFSGRRRARHRCTHARVG